MKKTSYRFNAYRFALALDEKKKYHSQDNPKSRDRIRFKYRRPEFSPEQQLEVQQRIMEGLNSGKDVHLLLFGYFQHQQLVGQIIEYYEDMQIVYVDTGNRTEWIDVQDIINVDLDG